jgi:hypothetical protein
MAGAINIIAVGVVLLFDSLAIMVARAPPSEYPRTNMGSLLYLF